MIHLPACPTLAKALHDGATVIRVPVVPQPYLHPSLEDIWIVDLPDIHGAFHEKYLASVIQDHSPLGKPGDVLSVKEPWCGNFSMHVSYNGILYQATADKARGWHGAWCTQDDDGTWRDHYGRAFEWQSAETLPEDWIRLRYRVKAVRVERLELDERDAMLEGCPHGGRGSISIYGEEVLQSVLEWYRGWWDSRLTHDEYDEHGSFVREGERYGDVYPFDENPWTVAAEVVREEEK